MTTQRIQLGSIIILLIVAGLAFTLSLRAPSTFPVGERFTVGEGESLASISERLEDEHIVSSALFFRLWISTIGRDKHIGLGVYEFTTPLPLGLVVAKIVRGPDEPLILVTIPEGYTSEEIAQTFKKVLPNFSAEAFITKVKEEKLDGYLFPSTYYPLPSDTENDIIARLNSAFERQYAKFFNHLPYPSGIKSKNDVVSLAAILEGEAKTPEDMKIVSGILQKRLEKGMRLQVDVAPVTYKQAGLPQVPINNPGFVAIEAVFKPVETPYLYYLTGKDGTMHYAKTFEEHKKNIQKYL